MKYHHTVSWCKGHEEQTNDCPINPHNEMPKDTYHYGAGVKYQYTTDTKVEVGGTGGSMPKDTVEERGMDFHMQGLSRAENAKDIGDCTVVRLGFVTSLMHDAYDKGAEVGSDQSKNSSIWGLMMAKSLVYQYGKPNKVVEEIDKIIRQLEVSL